MIIVGWIITIIGVLTGILNLNDYNNAVSSDYGYGRYYNRGSVEDSELAVFISIAILIIGVIILAAGYMKRRDNGGTGGKNIDYMNTIKCLKCGNITDKNEKFCTKCGNNLSEQVKRAE